MANLNFVAMALCLYVVATWTATGLRDTEFGACPSSQVRESVAACTPGERTFAVVDDVFCPFFKKRQPYSQQIDERKLRFDFEEMDFALVRLNNVECVALMSGLNYLERDIIAFIFCML